MRLMIILGLVFSSYSALGNCKNLYLSDYSVRTHLQQPSVGNIYRIYVSKSDGDDTFNGTSRECPVATLRGAHVRLKAAEAILRKYSRTHLKYVEVAIEGGRYSGGFSRGSIDSRTDTVKVGNEIYWTFSLPNKYTYISGSTQAGNPTIFDGRRTKGPTRFMNISRSAQAEAANEEQNLIFRNFRIYNYFEAFRIAGTRHVNSDITLQSLKYLNIGKAFDGGEDDIAEFNRVKGRRRNPASFPTQSHAAIYVNQTNGLRIISNFFNNITNQENCSASSFDRRRCNYSTTNSVDGSQLGYYGLHAIYVDRSPNLTVASTGFVNVYARGVLKLRDRSNFAILQNNRFYDNTNAIIDNYCEHGVGNGCNSDRGLQAIECPSYGVLLQGNRFRFDRRSYGARKNIEFDSLNKNEGYCKTLTQPDYRFRFREWGSNYDF